MDNSRHRTLRRATLALGVAALCGIRETVRADEAPAIELIVPSPPGGSADEIARIVAVALAEIGGRHVGVVHVAGDGGVTGVNALAARAPDGRSLGIAVSTAVVSGKLLNRLARFDPIQDFDWLAILGAYPNALVIGSGSNATTLQEWVRFARRSPQAVRYGSFGRGSAGHLAGGFLRKTEGLDMQHVAVESLDDGYDMLGTGELDLLFDGVPNALVEVPRRRGRIVGVTSAQRAPGLPDTVAFGELWKDRSFEVWLGVFAPRGLSPADFSALAANLAVMCNEPKYADRYRQAGMRFIGIAGRAARDFIEADILRTARMIADYADDAPR